MTLVLTASQLETLVDRPATIDAVARVFAEIARGEASQPAPTSMYTPSDTGRYVLMSAVSDETATAAVKLLADVPENSARGLPTQRSTILVVGRRDGEPLAVLHGGVPTRVRTAAASAVATRVLARPDSRVLGLVGAGNLAREHLLALRTVRDFERIVISSRTRERAEALAAEFADESIEVVDSVEDVFGLADVVCTLTPSVHPLVRGEWLRPGQHLNVVGARPRPDEREVDAATMARSSVWVDDRATAETKSGDLLLAVAESGMALADVVGTIGEVIAHRARGRASDEEITLFDSVGIGAQDLAIADLLVDAARARGIGHEIDLAA
ncbi:ornithine cyclodeaminase family protein [Microbacterium marinilacus]|uniref:Ornithine cyclodeaminase n=1 Tax=Microbacterium marinilacus TaxID=415209 RepID=A0ABP7BMC2_9MICO|nr:ornithine cyclodeaminase family protein [Microbacterium marinilacus]MBY0690496.1 ornithine cyclodeaminase family protein [Microbacterium marinilacus]